MGEWKESTKSNFTKIRGLDRRDSTLLKKKKKTVYSCYTIWLAWPDMKNKVIVYLEYVT